jgi:hypothetical protein
VASTSTRAGQCYSLPKTIRRSSLADDIVIVSEGLHDFGVQFAFCGDFGPEYFGRHCQSKTG